MIKLSRGLSLALLAGLFSVPAQAIVPGVGGGILLDSDSREKAKTTVEEVVDKGKENARELERDTREARTKALKALGAGADAAATGVGAAPPHVLMTEMARVVTGHTRFEDLDEALSDRAEKFAEKAGTAMVTASQATRETGGTHLSLREKAAGSIAGKVAVRIARAQNTVSRHGSYPLMLLEWVGRTLRGEDLPPELMPAASALATAIEAARDHHRPSSAPVPEEVKAKLRGVISQDVLNSARFVVGELGPTLPSAINTLRARVFAEGAHAVTVIDVIVFSRMPNDTTDLEWWAHELHHVQQYRDWGVLKFAANYIEDYAGVEADADAVQSRVPRPVTRR